MSKENIYGSKKIRALINDKENLEFQTRESTELNRVLLSIMPDGILTVAVHGKIIKANHVYCKFSGYSSSELRKLSLSALEADKSPKEIQVHLQRILQNGKERFESRHRKKDGSIVDVAITALCARRKNKQILFFIRESLKSKKSLPKTENKFKELVESTSDWIWEVDQNAVYTYVSPKVKSLLGYMPSEIIGKTPFDLMPGDEAQKIAKRFDAILKKSKPFQGLENWNIRKNGTLILLETSGVPIFEESGRLIGYRGIDRDITERKKVEEDLRMAKERYDLLFNSISEGFAHYKAIYDENGKLSDLLVLDVNPAAERFLGFKKEELVGKTWRNLRNGIEESLINRYAKVDSTGQQCTFEDYNKLTNKWFLSKIEKISTDQFAVTFFDITDRKTVEDELYKSRLLLSNIINSSDSIISARDVNDKLIMLNDAVARTYKMSKAEAIGTTPYDVYPKAVADAIIAWNKKVLREGKTYRFEEIIPIQGKPRTFLTNKFPLRDAAGRSYGIGLVSTDITELKDITERKKAEEALKQSEEQLRVQEKRLSLIYQNVSETMFFISVEPNNRFLFTSVNQSFLDATGLQENQVVGKSVHEVIPEPSLKLVLEKYNQAIKEKQTVRWEEVTVYPKGKKYGEVTVSPIFDSSGCCIYLVGNVHDITERKRMEEAIKESQKKYQDLTETTNDFVWEIDTNGKYIYCSPQIEKLWGLKPAEMIGKTPFDKMPPDAKEKIIASFVALSSSPKAFSRLEVPSYDSQDHLIFLEISGVPFFDDNGKLLGFRGMSRDITERKKAEEELRQSEQRYRLLFNSMAEMFFVAELIYDSNGKVVDWVYLEVNGLFLKALRKTKAQVVGKSAKELLGNIEESWLEKFAKIEITGQSIHSEQLSKRTGRYFDVFAWKANSKQVGVIFQDTTQRRKMESQLREKERLANIGATAGMVGHDIRNPLQAIVGEVYLLKADLESLEAMPESKTKESMAEGLSNIEENISYINKIVADLQDYARPLNPDFSDVNLSEVIDMTLKSIRPPESIKLSINTSGRLILKTDSLFIRRALTNLVNNAIQAMPSGGNLTIGAYTYDGKVLITVEDTGMGIREEVKPMLFTPMVTTKAKGQGLGLAVVKRLVEALNGTIAFESQEGKGTKFTIQLPIVL